MNRSDWLKEQRRLNEAQEDTIWPLIQASGRMVFGIDQSRGILARAHEKFPDVPIEKVGLQEMRYKDWVQQAGFHLIDKTAGEEYHHFIVQKVHSSETPIGA